MQGYDAVHVTEFTVLFCIVDSTQDLSKVVVLFFGRFTYRYPRTFSPWAQFSNRFNYICSVISVVTYSNNIFAELEWLIINNHLFLGQKIVVLHLQIRTLTTYVIVRD